MSDNIRKFSDKQYRDLIELQQDIATGMSSDGVDLSNGQIIKDITRISKTLSAADHARLISQYLINYECVDEDRESLLNSIPEYDFQQAVRNLGIIDRGITSGN